MSKSIDPHPVSHKDPAFCLTEDDFTGEGLHKVLAHSLARELSDEFERAVHRRFKPKRWKISRNGSSPWHGNLPMMEVRPIPFGRRVPDEDFDESFVLDFNIIPISGVKKKNNNSPVVQCRILRYVRGKYMGAIHESLRSGAGTYNPDQWAYLAHVILKAWVEHDEVQKESRRY